MNAIVVSALLGVLMMFSGLFFRKSKQIQALALVAFTGLLASTLYDKFLVSGSEQSFFGILLKLAKTMQSISPYYFLFYVGPIYCLHLAIYSLCF